MNKKTKKQKFKIAGLIALIASSLAIGGVAYNKSTDTSDKKTEEQIDFLRFQVNEIDSAELSAITEDDDLNNELSILENVEKLKELTGSSYWSLSGDNGSILEALFQIKTSVSKASGMDNTLSETESELISAIENLKEVSSTLREYSSSLENDTERINEIQERLFLLEKLKLSKDNQDFFDNMNS